MMKWTTKWQGKLVPEKNWYNFLENKIKFYIKYCYNIIYRFLIQDKLSET